MVVAQRKAGEVKEASCLFPQSTTTWTPSEPNQVPFTTPRVLVRQKARHRAREAQG